MAGVRAGGPRTYSQSSPLRPIFSSMFPTFNQGELENRAAELPPHLATHLHPQNILTYTELYGSDWWREFLALDFRLQREMLCEVLALVGISRDTVAGFSAVPRHMFVPDKYRKLAYVNWSIPTLGRSALSAPGIVAAFCEQIPRDASGVAVEVGIGTGYHAAVLAKKCPALTIVGFESYSPIAQMGIATLAELSMQESVRIVPQAYFDEISDCRPQHVYHTAFYRGGPVESLKRTLSEGGTYSYVRPLSKTEYSRLPHFDRTKKDHPAYEAYLQLAGNRTCAIESAIKVDGALCVTSTLYGVRFVDWESETIEEALNIVAINPMLDKLAALEE